MIWKVVGRSLTSRVWGVHMNIFHGVPVLLQWIIVAYFKFPSAKGWFSKRKNEFLKNLFNTIESLASSLLSQVVLLYSLSSCSCCCCCHNFPFSSLLSPNKETFFPLSKTQPKTPSEQRYVVLELCSQDPWFQEKKNDFEEKNKKDMKFGVMN